MKTKLKGQNGADWTLRFQKPPNCIGLAVRAHPRNLIPRKLFPLRGVQLSFVTGLKSRFKKR
jgi:hypothetical protein